MKWIKNLLLVIICAPFVLMYYVAKAFFQILWELIKLPFSLLTGKSKKKSGQILLASTKSATDVPSKEFKGFDLSPLLHKIRMLNPKEKKAQLAQSTYYSILYNIDAATQADNLKAFLARHDYALQKYNEFKTMDKGSFVCPSSVNYEQFFNEFQLNLCNVIVREKEIVIAEINDKYRNSVEFQQNRVKEFESSIERVKDRFSPGTAELAQRTLAELKQLVGLETPEEKLSLLDEIHKYGGADAEMFTIDRMEGHGFEHWCAEALSNSGFTNVEVTPGSGDQGVDVLAEKDGVKYAVQCKRYTSDLGNTPVQEVHSGKDFYHCHIGAVMTNRYFTAGAKELAKETGTLLWDRDWITNYLAEKHNHQESVS